MKTHQSPNSKTKIQINIEENYLKNKKLQFRAHSSLLPILNLVYFKEQENIYLCIYRHLLISVFNENMNVFL